MYNTTQLNPDTAFERHVFHRDMMAHYLRWSHVLKIAEIGMNILDFGCGSGNIYEVFYRNKFAPKRFLGLDIRKQTIEKNKIKFPKAEWNDEDLVNMKQNYGNDWNVITSFEVLEHIGKNNGDKFLQNIRLHCNDKTIVLISTPNYDEGVGAAGNHTYDSGDGRGVAPQEYTYQELQELFSKYFTIEKVWGTFASIRDYKDSMNDWQKQMFESLYEYFDVNILSNLMAPMFPEQSRNCLWQLKIK